MNIFPIVSSQIGPWGLNEAIGNWGGATNRPGSTLLETNYGWPSPAFFNINAITANYTFADGGSAPEDFALSIGIGPSIVTTDNVLTCPKQTNTATTILTSPIAVSANDFITLLGSNLSNLLPDSSLTTIDVTLWLSSVTVTFGNYFLSGTFASYGAVLSATFPFGFGANGGVPLQGMSLTIPSACGLVGAALSANDSLTGNAIASGLTIDIQKNAIDLVTLALPPANLVASANYPIGTYPLVAGDTIRVECGATEPDAGGIVGSLLFSM